jgi:hypothetical protein
LPHTSRLPKKPRPPERDYSHRSLIEKLGVKAGQKIAVLGVGDAEFLRDLAALVPEYSRGERIAGADLIFFSAEAPGDLSRVKSLVKSIQPAGAIWVVYPKGQKHIREVDVIAAGKASASPTTKSAAFPKLIPLCDLLSR